MEKDGKISGMFTARPPDKLLGNVGIKTTQARLSKIKVLDATAPRYPALSAAIKRGDTSFFESLKRWHSPICQALKRLDAKVMHAVARLYSKASNHLPILQAIKKAYRIHTTLHTKIKKGAHKKCNTATQHRTGVASAKSL